MKRTILTTVVLFAVAVTSYLAGYWRATREADTVSLAHALEKTALCANALNTLADGRQDRTAALLAQQLRASVATVHEQKAAGAGVPLHIPNLIDGLRRAKVYADRVGDAQLSARLARLHDELRTLGSR